MTIVKVATANPTKVGAVTEAFYRFFSELKVFSYQVNSGVPKQPFNEDVYRGAENRLKSIKEQGEDYDYIVSCEGGVIQLFDKYFNIQMVIIERHDGKRSMGLSQGFEIPQKWIPQIKDTSIAEVFDEIFLGRGGIRELTKNNVTREDLVKNATMMALAGFTKKEW